MSIYFWSLQFSKSLLQIVAIELTILFFVLQKQNGSRQEQNYRSSKELQR